MWFWIKHLSLAFILIAAAIMLLMDNGEYLLKKTESNAAAKGVSSFYASIRDASKQLIDDKNVVLLDEPNQNLNILLERRAKVVKPSSPNWRGQEKARRFEKGETLKQVMSQFADQEGIVLIWNLNRDFIVKDNFRVDDNFVSTLHQVGRAIDSEFEYDVFTYYCHKERSAVITENPTLYIQQHCTKSAL
jgi:hypothetical protein